MTNKPTWGEQYEKEIVPEIRKSVVNYSRFANSNRNASYDAYEALTKGNSLVSDNHTADLQYKLKQFISTKLAEQKKEKEDKINNWAKTVEAFEWINGQPLFTQKQVFDLIDLIKQ